MFFFPFCQPGCCNGAGGEEDNKVGRVIVDQSSVLSGNSKLGVTGQIGSLSAGQCAPRCTLICVEENEVVETFDEEDSPKAVDPKALEQDILLSCEVKLLDFTIALDRPSPKEPLNIEFTYDKKFSHLVVWRPSGKLMQKYQRANPNKRVRPLDQIISVDGTTGDAHVLIERLSRLNSPTAMAGSAAPQDYIELVLRRYESFVVDVDLTGERIGLEFNEAFIVVAVLAGAIQNQWNGSKMPSLDVCVGDVLVEVNGATSDFDKSLLIQREQGPLRLVFARSGISPEHADE